MAKVSVVIPVFNGEEFVAEAIHSALAQSWADLEVIVVNDGSADSTADVIARIDDRRLRCIHQSNLGLPAARNTGIRAATGDYVAFLDSDDVWSPDKLTRQIEIMERRPEVGLVYGGYQLIDASGKVLKTRVAAEIPEPVLQHLARANLVAGSATTSLVRRRCFERAGTFDETLCAGEDWDLWLRIARHFELACVETPVASIRIHAHNMTGQVDRMELGLLSVVDKLFSDEELPLELVGQHQKAYAGALFQSAIFCERGGRRRRAVERLLKVIRIDPFWADPYIVLVRVVFRVDIVRVAGALRSSLGRPRLGVESGTP